MATITFIRQLEEKRGLFFQIGLTVSLLITWVALQLKFTYTVPDFTIPDGETEPMIFEIPVVENKSNPAPAPAKPIVNKQPVNTTIVPATEPVAIDKPVEMITPDNTDPAAINTLSNSSLPEFIPPVPPEFYGGMDALYRYLQNNLKYDRKAVREGISGTVYVNFKVDEFGNISDVKVIKGVHPLLDREAIRVVSMMPAWIPGKNYDGTPVAYFFSLPVSFKIKQ
jgi:protein TonB